jgi:pyruvate,water dikinase
VLVCTSTDPGWTPLFVHARGVIVERGGMLSHGAIVARDFGIPAVVLKNATRLIPDGAAIRVDGTRGRVELLGAPAAANAKESGRD